MLEVDPGTVAVDGQGTVGEQLKLACAAQRLTRLPFGWLSPLSADADPRPRAFRSSSRTASGQRERMAISAAPAYA
jgi:hypothetical protein